MPTAGMFVLLGLGVGAIVLAGRALQPGMDLSPHVRAELLRTRAIEAQRRADRAAQEARELTERWAAAYNSTHGQ